MGLREKALQMNNQGFDFMDGRHKAELKEIRKQSIVLKDFGIAKGEEGEYIIFVIQEDEENFYVVGGSAVLEKFKQFDKDDMKEIRTEGLPALFDIKKNKTGKREYNTVLFFPDEVM